MVSQSGTVHSTEHRKFGSGWTGIALSSVWSKHVGGLIMDLAATGIAGLVWSTHVAGLHRDHTCSGWTANRRFKT